MHKTKLVQYKEMSAEIDENMADLILLCWKLDILTFLSCEDSLVHPGFVMIQFSGAQDFENFLSLIGSISKRSDIHFRMMPNWILQDSPECDTGCTRLDCKKWKYEIDFMESSEDDKKSKIILMPLLWFPISEIQYLKWCFEYELERINANISSSS